MDLPMTHERQPLFHFQEFIYENNNGSFLDNNILDGGGKRQQYDGKINDNESSVQNKRRQQIP